MENLAVGVLVLLSVIAATSLVSGTFFFLYKELGYKGPLFLILFFVLSYFVGSLVLPAHATSTEFITAENGTFCQKFASNLEKMESNLADDADGSVDGYDTMVGLQEKYQTDCEEEGN